MAIFGFIMLVIVGLIVSGYACALWWMALISRQISGKAVITLSIAATVVTAIGGGLFWIAAIFSPFQVVFQ